MSTGWSDTLVYRSRKIWSWANFKGVTLQRMPFAKKHWIDRNEAVDIQWKISIKITTKNCQSAPAETCLDNSARNIVPPRKMEEYFARISEGGETASPFTLNCCARDIYCPCKNPPARLNFWFTAEAAERNADRICSAALPVFQQTCPGAFSEHYFWKAPKWITSIWEALRERGNDREAFLWTVEFQLIKVMKQLLWEWILPESMTDAGYAPFPAAQHKSLIVQQYWEAPRIHGSRW